MLTSAIVRVGVRGGAAGDARYSVVLRTERGTYFLLVHRRWLGRARVADIDVVTARPPTSRLRVVDAGAASSKRLRGICLLVLDADECAAACCGLREASQAVRVDAHACVLWQLAPVDGSVALVQRRVFAYRRGSGFMVEVTHTAPASPPSADTFAYLLQQYLDGAERVAGVHLSSLCGWCQGHPVAGGCSTYAPGYLLNMFSAMRYDPCLGLGLPFECEKGGYDTDALLAARVSWLRVVPCPAGVSGLLAAIAALSDPDVLCPAARQLWCLDSWSIWVDDPERLRSVREDVSLALACGRGATCTYGFVLVTLGDAWAEWSAGSRASSLADCIRVGLRRSVEHSSLVRVRVCARTGTLVTGVTTTYSVEHAPYYEKHAARKAACEGRWAGLRRAWVAAVARGGCM